MCLLASKGTLILVLFQIKPGTQSHETMIMSGKGMSRVNSYGFGDHIIHIKIKTPL